MSSEDGSFVHDETFGQILRRLRKAVDMKQRDLAEALTASGWKVTPQAVSGWERDEYRPQKRTQIDAIDKIVDGDGELLRYLGYLPPSSDIGGDDHVRRMSELREVSGTLKRLVAAASDALEQGDVAAVRALLQPTRDAVEELVHLTDETIDVQPEIGHDAGTLLRGLADVLDRLADVEDEAAAEVAKRARFSDDVVLADDQALAAGSGTITAEGIDISRTHQTYSQAERQE